MELIDIVNDHNAVIGRISKDQLYDGPNNHRIVHVLIFNNKGDVALQLRSRTVAFLPSHWTTVVGGHVQAGETVEQAAKREMVEEIGVAVPFKKLFEIIYVPPQRPDMKKFLTIFKATHNGPFTPNPEDVERVEFFSPNKIKQKIARGKNLHHEMVVIMKTLLQNKNR
ncbi:MAG: NUDIX domain-containing protein [Patescibacteria group bacterium]